MKEIPLGYGQNAKVDDEDYEWLSGYSWVNFLPMEIIGYSIHRPHFFQCIK